MKQGNHMTILCNTIKKREGRLDFYVLSATLSHLRIRDEGEAWGVITWEWCVALCQSQGAVQSAWCLCAWAAAWCAAGAGTPGAGSCNLQQGNGTSTKLALFPLDNTVSFLFLFIRPPIPKPVPSYFSCKWTPHPGPPLSSNHFCFIFTSAFKQCCIFFFSTLSDKVLWRLNFNRTWCPDDTKTVGH